MRIYLTGFMGAGKSTVGRLLAERRGCAFVDLDDDIERVAGAEIPEIFDRRGEAQFRTLEKEALVRSLSLERAVIATGGGALVAPQSRALLTAEDRVVFLHVPFELVVDRLRGDTSRPLLRDIERAERLYQERLESYRLCDLEIEITAEDEAEHLADRIYAHWT